jgi:hypothetical protein
VESRGRVKGIPPWNERSLFGEIGYARSVLAYELPDGHLKLIDGHPRQSELDPEELIDVEVLDVSDEEARKLLLSIDPLAQLADYDTQALDQLRQVTTSDNDALTALWQSLGQAAADTEQALDKPARKRQPAVGAEQYLIIIECDNERVQVELLR